MYALGSNGSAQLGIGHEDDVSSPTQAVLPNSAKDNQLIKVAAGGNHTLLLFASGKVYLAGANAPDHPESTTEPGPLSIPRLLSLDSRKVKHCSATWASSALVTDDNRILTFGIGSKGELAQGPTVTEDRTGHGVPGFPPPGVSIVDMASSMAHTLAVLSNGDVYGWGNGRRGQLGQPAEIVWSPRKIAGIPFAAKRAVCGKDFTYIVGSPESGEHVVLGADKFGVVSTAPTSVAGWKDIGASWGSVIVLLASGEFLAWGRNDHGQLPPPELPPVQQIAAGSEHALALTRSGDVLAWGWGEHGNCGLPIDAKGDVIRRWNKLAVEGTVLRIGAGCATSWIYTE